MSEQVRQLFLQFLNPDYIVAFLIAHPIVWPDREICRLGGLADRAGRSPTSVVGEFHTWITQHDLLPTQSQFSEFCLQKWHDDYGGWPRLAYKDAVRQKLERNFYPSCIDMYHAYGLLATAGWYDRCSMDSVEDVIGKADVTLYGPSLVVRINLKGPASAVSREAERYKANHRGHGLEVVQIRMPRRDIGAGNKRWYHLSDFAAIQPSLFGAA